MSEPPPGLPLSDLIEAVRVELRAAAFDGRDSDLQFEVQDVTLQVEIAATGTKGVDGGVKLWAVNLGGNASKSNTSTQTVTLKLGAVNSSGSRFRVSDLSSKPVRQE